MNPCPDITQQPQQALPKKAGSSSSVVNNEFEPDAECLEYLKCLIRKEAEFMPCSTYLTTTQTSSFMTPNLRAQCVDWFFDETEKMKFDLDTAAIGLNVMERYMSLRELTSKQEMLLALYSSFSLAARIHENVLVQCWDSKSGAAASTGRGPSRDDVKLMETDILDTISWRMHPVTPHLVARNVLALLPQTNDRLEQQRMDDVDTLLFIATRQHSLLHDSPSTIAFAAVLASSAYSKLSTVLLWDLVDSIDEIDRSRVSAQCKDMEDLLNLDDDVLATPSVTASSRCQYQDRESPTGIDTHDGTLLRQASAPTDPNPRKRKLPADTGNAVARAPALR